jgi:hypothetical protein
VSAGSIFSAQISEFVAKAKGNATLVVRRVALDMFGRVIQKSPVDEGRFKSSYLVSVNSVPSGDPGTIDKSGAPSLARVSAAVLAMKVGDTITMTSSLAYALRLEYGWSQQAPAGMVRLTVAEFAGIVTQAASELPK